MTTGRNGNVVKWIAIIIGVTMAAVGWVYQLGVQGEQLKVNSADDDATHPKVTENRESIIGIKKDVENINQTFTEFQRQSLENQKEILRALAR